MSFKCAMLKSHCQPRDLNQRPSGPQTWYPNPLTIVHTNHTLQNKICCKTLAPSLRMRPDLSVRLERVSRKRDTQAVPFHRAPQMEEENRCGSAELGVRGRGQLEVKDQPAPVSYRSLCFPQLCRKTGTLAIGVSPLIILFLKTDFIICQS